MTEKRVQELNKEKEELVARFQEYQTVMNNIQIRVNQIDGALMEHQREVNEAGAAEQSGLDE